MSDGLIVVDRDNEHVGFGGGGLQIADVADVEQVEATVGKRDRATSAALGGDGVNQFVPRKHPSHYSVTRDPAFDIRHSARTIQRAG
jgi:hypothetical protein